MQPANVDTLYHLWRQDGGPHIVAGSLHPGETPIVAEAWRRLSAAAPAAKLLVVPRHPERTPQVAAAFAAAGLSSSIWPQQSAITLVDMFGVLAGLYGLADAAIVGGSWNGKGGHNPVEAMVHGVGVVMGPSIKNQQAIVAVAGLQIAVADSADALAKKLLDYARHGRFTAAPFAEHTAAITAMAKAALG